MCVYICMFYIYVYLYLCIYVCSSVYISASLYVCVHAYFCLHESYLVNCLSCRYLGCYLSVCQCYLGSILAFSFEIVKLNTTTCTKSSTQVTKINLGIISDFNCQRFLLHVFIYMNKFWFIDWLIDWLIDSLEIPLTSQKCGVWKYW